eukprot:3726133-Rhodomonas_salina.2
MKRVRSAEQRKKHAMSLARSDGRRTTRVTVGALSSTGEPESESHCNGRVFTDMMRMMMTEPERA